MFRFCLLCIASAGYTKALGTNPSCPSLRTTQYQSGSSRFKTVTNSPRSTLTSFSSRAMNVYSTMYLPDGSCETEKLVRAAHSPFYSRHSGGWRRWLLPWKTDEYRDERAVNSDFESNWIGRDDSVAAGRVAGEDFADCEPAWSIWSHNSRYPNRRPAPVFQVGKTILNVKISMISRFCKLIQWIGYRILLLLLLSVVLCRLVASPFPPPVPPPPPGPPPPPALLFVSTFGMPKSRGSFFLTVRVISPRCGVYGAQYEWGMKPSRWSSPMT